MCRARSVELYEMEPSLQIFIWQKTLNGFIVRQKNQIKNFLQFVYAVKI